MQDADLSDLSAVYRDGLFRDVLPFWLEHGIDRECGGFFTALDKDGRLLDTDKYVWQQGRFAWLLGELYNNVERRDEWLALARHGLDFLEAHAFDHNRDGRMFFHLTRDGRPIRKRRYNFSESFAAIAFAEYAKATGSARHRDRAIELLREFIRYNAQGAAPPKFTTVRPMKSIGVPMITLATAQELREAVELEDADAIIDRVLDEIRRDFVRPELEVVMETVGPEGQVYDHFDGRTLNPGHAIECAWFVLREAAWRDNNAGLIRLGAQMLDWMWQRGWDEEFGGILYFRDLHHRPVQEYWHDMKFWWPQCEGLIATLLAGQLTGDEKYARWHRQLHGWVHARFPDPEYGEWFGYLHRNGTLSTPMKGNMWKGPFHIPRMQLICWRRLENAEGGDAGRP